MRYTRRSATQLEPKKKLRDLGFPDADSIDNSLVPNLVRFPAEQNADLDPNTLNLSPGRQFSDMQGQVANAPLKEDA
jgi:hypothetical protein